MEGGMRGRGGWAGKEGRVVQFEVLGRTLLHIFCGELVKYSILLLVGVISVAA